MTSPARVDEVRGTALWTRKRLLRHLEAGLSLTGGGCQGSSCHDERKILPVTAADLRGIFLPQMRDLVTYSDQIQPKCT